MDKYETDIWGNRVYRDRHGNKTGTSHKVGDTTVYENNNHEKTNYRSSVDGKYYTKNHNRPPKKK
jgi:hypothetical protein